MKNKQKNKTKKTNYDEVVTMKFYILLNHV